MAQNKSIKAAMASAETIQMFKNPLLEKFTHVHPATPFVLYIPFVAFLVYYSAAQQLISLVNIGLFFLVGIAGWLAAEYILHRWFFHPPQINWFFKKMYFYLHGIHHDAPNDATRLVMPPLASIPIAIGIYFLFKSIAPVHHLPLLAGFITGYMFYDFMHFATHFYNWKNPYFRYIRKAHMIHHHRAPGKNFCITLPLVDVLLFSSFKQPANEPVEEG